MATQAQNPQPYLQGIRDVIAAGNQFLDWLPRNHDERMFALGKLVQAVDVLYEQTLARQKGSGDPEEPFLQAAAEMRTGYLFIEAGRTVENGERAGVVAALAQLADHRS